MKKDDILVGGAYRITSYSHMGRAVVKGPSYKKSRYSWESPQNYFPVEFPDSIKDGKLEEGTFTSRMFEREWTDEDEDHFQEIMAKGAILDKIQDQLEIAGYPARIVRVLPNKNLWIDFEGDVAERVCEKLTGQKVTR